MGFIKLILRVFIYSLIVVSLIFLTISLKLILNYIGEETIYNILIVGEFIAVLQIVELVNVIVFAVLGMGFGCASLLLPKICQLKTSAVLLIISVPLIFSLTPLVKYNAWIERVADNEHLSYTEAQVLTNSFLKSRANLDGFLGFYAYSAQFPVLPNSKKEMLKVANWEQKVKAQFMPTTKKLKLNPQLVSAYLAAGNWTIRFFYFSLSAFTTISHFHLGRQLMEKQLLKVNVSIFPPVPLRHQTQQNKPVKQPIPLRGKPKVPALPHRSEPITQNSPSSKPKK